MVRLLHFQAQSLFQDQERLMKFSQVVILFAGSFAFAHATCAQSLTASEVEAPVLTEAQPANAFPDLFPQRVEPAAPLASQVDLTDSRATEDRYRAEIESIAESKQKFIRCKLKNGKILTGRVHAPGYEAFTLHTDARFIDGKYIYYKDLAELPRTVPAVGTRIKQGMQWAGIVTFVVVFFIPLAMTHVIPDC